MEKQGMSYLSKEIVQSLAGKNGNIVDPKQDISEQSSKRKSSFDFEDFYDGYNNCMGFNKQKYTKKQAIETWYSEQMIESNTPCVIEEGYVRYRYGVDEENVRQNGWWLELEEHGSCSVPVWIVGSIPLDQ